MFVLTPKTFSCTCMYVYMSLCCKEYGKLYGRHLDEELVLVNSLKASLPPSQLLHNFLNCLHIFHEKYIVQLCISYLNKGISLDKYIKYFDSTNMFTKLEMGLFTSLPQYFTSS